jgi:hypothetical protein
MGLFKQSGDSVMSIEAMLFAIFSAGATLALNEILTAFAQHHESIKNIYGAIQ